MSKRAASLLILALLCLVGFGAGPPSTNPQTETERYIAENTEKCVLIILGSGRDYHRLEHAARQIGLRAGVRFSNQGMIFDAKRGLIVPDDADDDMYRGCYVLRRYNFFVPGQTSPYISIERSEAYPGLKPGYYIIVGGIYDTPKDAAHLLGIYRKPVPDAYLHWTTIYMGCMH